MMKKILITGASGFIGPYIVEEALKRNYEVHAAVRNTSNLNALEKFKVHFHEFDFTDSCKIFSKISSLPRFDYIIHNAGLTKSLKKETFYDVNLRITKHLVNSFHQQNKKPDKFLYVSSLAAFGPGKHGCSEPVCCSSMPQPITHYGKSKLKAEQYIINKALIPYIIVRPTAVYGPGEKDLFLSIKLINEGFNFKIGTAKQYLSFVYVKDLARLMLDALESPLFNKEYFVSDGNLYSPYELGNLVANLLQRKHYNVAIPVWLALSVAFLTENISRVRGKTTVINMEKIKELAATNWNCDIQPAKSDLNYNPEYNLTSGMKETISWYQKEGWLKI